MGRPRRVRYDTLHLYDKLHTKKEKLCNGTEFTILYPIKETAHFYQSIEVWAYCASRFRIKKDNFKPSINLPIVEDKKVITFLDKHCWKDWVNKELGDKKSDIPETIELLNRLFPRKEKIFFYELNSLISTYLHNAFKGENAKYYNAKYNKFGNDPEVAIMRKRWTEEKDKTLSDKYLTEYIKFEREYYFKHNNLIDVFIKLSKNAVCYPVAFSRGTAEWSKEKYGKEIAYAKAGEIYFVQTSDKVYFEVNRHY